MVCVIHLTAPPFSHLGAYSAQRPGRCLNNEKLGQAAEALWTPAMGGRGIYNLIHSTVKGSTNTIKLSVMHEVNILPPVDTCKYHQGSKTEDCGDPDCVTSMGS